MPAVPDLAGGRTAAATPPTLLQVAALTKRYEDQPALSGVSFDVRPGELLGLIGPNGAGKTTLLEAIAGLLPIDSGEVVWRGSPVRISERRGTIFYLPDGLRPWDEQYVLRVLEFFTAVYGRTDAALANVIHAVGLASVLDKRVASLSKGFSRRLMLALALLTPHPLLLMDEPFDGFDLRQTREVMTLLRRVADEGRTLVLAIHQLTDAERVCDRFVLLAAGTVRGVGTLDALRADVQRPSASLEEIFLALT
jgi:ABC-2 type transport system ATP-binding protein